jgi:hypothetical protein
MGIHALTQDALRGHAIQPRRFAKIGVFSKPGDGLEITLAQTQQSDIALEDRRVRHRIAAQRRDRGRIASQVGALIQGHADESKPSMGSQIGFGFSDHEPAQRSTCWVNQRMRRLYLHPIVL